MVETNNNTVAEELENVICEKLKDLQLCDKVNCLECMSNYGFKIFATNQKIINENEDESDLYFTTICPNCMSVNVEEYVDYDYGFDEEVVGEIHYQACKDCCYDNRC